VCGRIEIADVDRTAHFGLVAHVPVCDATSLTIHLIFFFKMANATPLKADLANLAGTFEGQRLESAERVKSELLKELEGSTKSSTFAQWEQVVQNAVSELQHQWEGSEQALIRETYELATNYLQEAEEEVHRLQVAKRSLEEQLRAESTRNTQLEERLAELQSRLLVQQPLVPTEPQSQQEMLRTELQGFMQELVRNQRESLRVLQEELQRVREEASSREESLLRQIAHLKTELAVARTDGELSVRQLRQLESFANRGEGDDELGPGTIWPPHLTPRQRRHRWQRQWRFEDQTPFPG
jgi:chromosome segregation ATPase